MNVFLVFFSVCSVNVDNWKRCDSPVQLSNIHQMYHGAKMNPRYQLLGFSQTVIFEEAPNSSVLLGAGMVHISTATHSSTETRNVFAIRLWLCKLKS